MNEDHSFIFHFRSIRRDVHPRESMLFLRNEKSPIVVPHDTGYVPVRWIDRITRSASTDEIDLNHLTSVRELTL